MKRICYYVTYADSEKFQRGEYDTSPPLKTLNAARKFERELLGFGEINSRVELHHEIYERWAWEPDFEYGDWLKVIEDDDPMPNHH